MGEVFAPPHFSSLLDQDASSEGEPHHLSLELGDKTALVTGSGELVMAKYDAGVRKEMRFIPTGTGGIDLTIWAADTGVETSIGTIESDGAIYDVPHTFEDTSTFNGAMTIADDVTMGVVGTSNVVTCHHLPTFNKKVVIAAAGTDALELTVGGAKVGSLNLSAEYAANPTPGEEGMIWRDTTNRTRIGDTVALAYSSVPTITAGDIIVSSDVNGTPIGSGIIAAGGDITTIGSITSTGAVSATGPGTFGGVISSNGVFSGKQITGGVWWKIANIAISTNDSITMTIVTKDVDSNFPCVRVIYAGTSIPAGVIQYSHSIMAGAIINQPRIIAFTAINPTETLEISQLTHSTGSYDYPNVSWQSFTSVSGRFLSRFSAWMYSSVVTSFTAKLFDGEGIGDVPGVQKIPVATSAALLEGGGVSHYYDFVFTPPVALILGSVYTISINWSVAGSITWVYSDVDTYLDGTAGYWVPGASDIILARDRTFQLYTVETGFGAEDLYIYGQPEVGSLSKVTIDSNSTAPVWVNEGAATWPTGHSTGAGITFDTDDTSVYPPNTTMELGHLVAHSILDIGDDASILCRESLGSVNTIDATPTDIVTFLTTTDHAYSIKIIVTYSRVADGETGSFTFSYKCKNVGGILTNSATVLSASIIDPGLVGTDVTVGSSGATTTIVGTGLVGSNIKWGGRMKIVGIPL
jgi:hypothetical protein